MHKIPVFLLCCVVPVLLLSCSDAVAVRTGILAGTISWHNQNWSEATLSFFRASASEDREAAEFAAYGLALSYLAQNETAAADRIFSALTDSSPERLRAAAWYQKGICAYRTGEYPAAAECFRRSLEIEPARTDAKVNLELCLAKEKEKAESVFSASDALVSGQEADPSAAEQFVFSLIRKKEEERWKNAVQDTRAHAGPDY